MMGIAGFKTKKALKEAAKLNCVRPVFIETSMFGLEFKGDGEYTVVGPSPEVRKWYATVRVTDGVIAKVS